MPFAEPNPDGIIGDARRFCSIDEVSEEHRCRRILQTVPESDFDFDFEQVVKTSVHEGELRADVGAHEHGGREKVDLVVLDGLGNLDFDDHASCV